MTYLKKARERSASAAPELRRAVAQIIEEVREKGDAALIACSWRFDGCGRERLRVSDAEIERALSQTPAGALADMRAASANIRAFAEAQRATIGELPAFSPMPGVSLGHRVLPVRSCCCYVPGGTYPMCVHLPNLKRYGTIR